ncbi:hypothetical protein BpHYR1_039805 [Brachionus plicatilis]|uniref:Uncharacterized protein n=1 Tax=Brachionus plicatilis TaxID=10195 RepID=A0A3M7Q5A0_BRAPC|nr:hypothetical protein BpHYR1_039805 [Brachionus plicatilis]
MYFERYKDSYLWIEESFFISINTLSELFVMCPLFILYNFYIKILRKFLVSKISTSEELIFSKLII